VSRNRQFNVRHLMPPFLVGFAIGSVVAGAAWITKNKIGASDTSHSDVLNRWTEGIATTLFPPGILLLNPNAPQAMFAVLLVINGLAFGLASVLAWKIASRPGQVVALAATFILLALIFNNAWFLVAIGTAAQKGMAAGIGAATLIHWPSFFTIAISIVILLYILYRRRSRDDRSLTL
jgi:hypothetical protein